MDNSATNVETPIHIEIPTEKWKSEEIDKLAMSLSKAQASIKGAQVSSTNPFFNSKYADLHSVIQSSIPALTKHGLSIIQGNRFCTTTNGFYVTTTLLHSSGQWVRSEIRMPIGGKKDAHAIGSACTYGRRYGLSALTGVAQFDDDGNSSVTSRGLSQFQKEGIKLETPPHQRTRTNNTGGTKV